MVAVIFTFEVFQDLLEGFTVDYRNATVGVVFLFLNYFVQVHFVHVTNEPVHVHYAIYGQNHWPSNHKKHSESKPAGSGFRTRALRIFDCESELVCQDFDVGDG